MAWIPTLLNLFACDTDRNTLMLICEVIEMEMIDKCPASDCFMDFISQFADPLNALKTVFLLHSPIKQNHFTNTALGSQKSV